jgi:hypothetical protein
MKTIEERAKEIYFKSQYAQSYDDRIDEIIKALKEEQKITKRLCCEDIERYAEGYDLIGVKKAIINTKVI